MTILWSVGRGSRLLDPSIFGLLDNFTHVLNYTTEMRKEGTKFHKDFPFHSPLLWSPDNYREGSGQTKKPRQLARFFISKDLKI